MANRDLADSLSTVQTVKPANLTTANTTVAGGAVDLQGYDAAMVEATFGTWGDTTTGGWEVAVQHSDDTVNGNFIDVANAELSDFLTATSTVTGASTTGVFAKVATPAASANNYKTSYLGNKRYLRVKLAATGTQTTGTPIGVNVIRGRASVNPVVV